AITNQPQTVISRRKITCKKSWRLSQLPGHYPCLDARKEAERKSEIHYVLNKNGVEVHRYSSDPREPYDYQKYANFNDFFLRFISARAAGCHGSEVAFFPEVFKAHVTMMVAVNDANLDSSDKTNLMMDHTKIVSQNREENEKYYQEMTRHFMNGIFYRLVNGYVNWIIRT
uniref:hypothetical protein n=1 Tax=Hahella ganghwensis TaxID=286420 RepID=UPI00052544E9